VGECLPSHNPPAVLAEDAVRALDAAGIEMGVVLSCAYLYGLPSLHLSTRKIAALTRRENEFTATEVAKYPNRLVGFLSVDPLQPSAPEEIRHWSGRGTLVGLKLHFSASAVRLEDPAQRARVALVLKEADASHLPIVIHVGGAAFDARDAQTFVREVLPNAPSSWVQIAHAGGGFPLANHVSVLRVFADHIARDDPATRRLLFDLSYVPAPEEDDETVVALLREIRRIGIDRFLFGSDFNVLTPRQQIANLQRLQLTAEEMRALQRHCAPWACRE
jgi:predicted TIM-barrel fold metal-dependent hydrolase